MNRRTARTALVTAAVAGGTGVLLFATPVLANTGWGPGDAVGARTTTACPMNADGVNGNGTNGNGVNGNGMRGNGMRGNGMRGNGMNGNGMNGNGMNGNGMRGNGGMTGDPAANLPAQGTLTDAQKTALAGMAEEEKLAHDVYLALAASSGDARFTRIASSEARHLDAVRVLLDRYDVTDPTGGKADGTFASSSVQALYDTLVAQGKASPAAALQVGVTIEKTDIADLATAGTGVTAADVTTVYQRLSPASQHHLAAFGG